MKNFIIYLIIFGNINLISLCSFFENSGTYDYIKYYGYSDSCYKSDLFIAVGHYWNGLIKMKVYTQLIVLTIR
jgi:hypothetical protein